MLHMLFYPGVICCYLLNCQTLCSICRYRWAFVPEVDVNRYGGPETALIEGEQECTPHVVRVLEGIQQRYGVRSYIGWNIKLQTYSHFYLKVYTLELSFDEVLELIELMLVTVYYAHGK